MAKKETKKVADKSKKTTTKKTDNKLALFAMKYNGAIIAFLIVAVVIGIAFTLGFTL